MYWWNARFTELRLGLVNNSVHTSAKYHHTSTDQHCIHVSSEEGWIGAFSTLFIDVLSMWYYYAVAWFSF